MEAWIWSITTWLSWGPFVSTMYWYLIFGFILENWEWINTFQFHKDLCTQYLGPNMLKYFNNETTNWRFWDWDILCLSMIFCRTFWSNVTVFVKHLMYYCKRTTVTSLCYLKITKISNTINWPSSIIWLPLLRELMGNICTATDC